MSNATPASSHLLTVLKVKVDELMTAMCAEGKYGQDQNDAFRVAQQEGTHHQPLQTAGGALINLNRSQRGRVACQGRKFSVPVSCGCTQVAKDRHGILKGVGTK